MFHSRLDPARSITSSSLLKRFDEEGEIPKSVNGFVYLQGKQLQTAHANLIWSPVAFIDAGVEYTWGQRQTVANIKGQQQALIGKFRVKF